jgi:enterochelin esterase-like enzyme
VDVVGPGTAVVEVRHEGGGAWRPVPWDDLARNKVDPGAYTLRIGIDAEEGQKIARLPVCAGRKRVWLDNHELGTPAGPVVVPLTLGVHEIVMELEVSAYESRMACGERPRVGHVTQTREGLGLVVYDSPHVERGGGRAVVYLPPGHDSHRPSALLVGLHPWNGSMWTYAAYAELLAEARARDVVLLMPSGLGNSLYTADAESEVMRAIDALEQVVEIDPRRVSIWGASMGGAGATTIAFHHPDRFAGVTSFFGDSKYDLGTYVRSILHDEASAHRVNALDVVDNARNLPVWLVHGEADRTSPIRQSEILATAMNGRGFPVRFDRVPGEGHSGALVARLLPQVVAVAAAATVHPVDHVTYRSVRAEDVGAYGVRFVRTSAAVDALVDVQRRTDAVHVRAEGVREVWLRRGALGTLPEAPPPLVVDGEGTLHAAWEALSQ